ncbi:MAG: helicase C-terminal domain-containing protein [Thermodesulfovibrionales bacterium]
MDLDGLLSPLLPGYEPRAEQSRMAGAVLDALQSSGRLVVEAGTGTGKSLAYLIPLAMYALDGEKRAVVSTYTKALQRQLFEKELPFLREKLFGSLRYALAMGSENYLCLRRLDQARRYGLFTEDAEEVEALLEWAASTETGLRGDIPRGMGVGAGLWRRAAREPDLCQGRQCGFSRRCFYQKAKAAERQSHILVVNHHLYFAHVASGGKVLPAFDAAVFDEAHELEGVASGYLGVELSDYKLRYFFDGLLSGQGKGLLPRLKWLDGADFRSLAAMCEAARDASARFFGEVAERAGEAQKLRIREKGFVEDILSAPLMALSAELDSLARASSDEEERAEITALSGRFRASAEALSDILGQGLDGHVYWVERGARAVKLCASPVEVSGFGVFDALEAAVFTSATLSAGGSLSYIKERLGLGGARELLLESPFNYMEQALLYMPRDLEEPGRAGFEEAVIKRVGEILAITGGRTLVLFTSHGLLNRAAGALADRGVEILAQGDSDSYGLLEEFRKNGGSAIFGTHTFWQGVDVPGDALECVVITKLPFAVPDEPMVEARMEALRSRGLNPFTRYQLPQAILLLRQGFGRLIRTGTDRGVVAILDSRMYAKSYGREFLKSLPACKIAVSLAEAAAFLRGEAAPRGETASPRRR